MLKFTRHVAILFLINVIIGNSQPDSAPKIQSQSESISSRYTRSDSTAAIAILQSRLQQILSKAKFGAGAKYSLMVYSLDSRKTYFERNPYAPLTPASTTKLFSTFAAFATLGGSYGVPTNVYADAPIQNGVINGNLYLVGHGDALLTTSDIEELAEQIAKKGVKKITGTIYGDGTYFDNLTERHIYSGDREVVEAMPPITALGINRNTVTVMASPGIPPHVQTLPPSDAFTIVNSAQSISPQKPQITAKTSTISNKKTVKTTVTKNLAPQKKIAPKHAPKKSKITPRKSLVKKPSHSKRRASLEIMRYNPIDDIHNLGDAPPAPRGGGKRHTAKLPRVAAFTVSCQTLPNGAQQFVARGSVGRGGLHTSYFVIKKPELAAAGTLRNRLESGGVDVVGGIGVQAKPQSGQQIAEFKRPIAEIISLLNKNSDNFLAEHIFKMVGAAAGGQIETAKKSVETITQALEKEGISTEGLCINDGSGLCRRNLFSANTEVGLLSRAAELPFFMEFQASLALAGVDGTLKKRMKGTYAERNLHAKTGTLRNASALAGYVSTRNNERLAFAFIFNGGNVGTYKQTENELGACLAEFNLSEVLKEVSSHSK